MDRQSLLRVEIKNTQPVELNDLTVSLASLAAQFRRYAEANAYDIEGDELRLYVQEIKSGSIIAELVALASTTPMLLQHASAVVGFVKDLKNLYEFFAGKTPGAVQPQKEPKDLRNAAGILQTVVRDERGQIKISAAEGGKVVVNLHLSSLEANAIQNRVNNSLARMGQAVSGTHTEQLFVWYQARDENKSKAGDKGVISSISPRPVKVRFKSEEVKARMFEDPLFTLAYVVDVDVQSINGKPALYTILTIHESFPRDDDEEPDEPEIS